MPYWFSLYHSARVRAGGNAGQLTFWGIAVCVILAVAYLSFPQDVNHFVHFMLHSINGDLHKSFQPKTTGTTTATTTTGTLPDFRKH